MTENKSTEDLQSCQTAVIGSADKIKILNLYCGIGGNRKLWGDNYWDNVKRHLIWCFG